MTKLLPISALLVALALAGCGGSGDTSDEEAPAPAVIDPPRDPLPNIGPVPQKSLLNCANGTHLTYANFGEGFLRNYCVMCHGGALPEGSRGGAPLGMNFDTAGDAALWRAGMLAKAGSDNSPQPPVNNVSSAERGQFAEWLSCGAPAS